MFKTKLPSKNRTCDLPVIDCDTKRAADDIVFSAINVNLLLLVKHTLFKGKTRLRGHSSCFTVGGEIASKTASFRIF